MRARRVVPLVLATLLVALPALPASEQAPRRKLGAVVSPVRLVPNSADPIAVSGLNRYFGSVEISSASDGLVVSNHLSLERYLLGLNEVPSRWPMAALRAQAVAARTYALNTLRRPTAGAAATYGFDICATVACQVYSGADVVEAAFGTRWAHAVASTEGQTILYQGEPILARYHSTSGGRTFSNPQIFPSEPDYPYLRPVDSTTEGGSPLYRWKTSFRVRQLQRMLVRAGWWDRSALGRLRSVRTAPSREGLHYPDVVLRGGKGTLRRSAEELRVVVRETAPAMFPSRYPSAAPTTSGRLPEVFPSNRLEIQTQRGVVEVSGRGWGHGVGMSQWGAHGMAARGASPADILTHYYTGVSVGEFPQPDRIEVGVDWGRSRAAASGSFRIVDGRGRVLVRRALGTWRFEPSGAGAVAVKPPKGFGLPLRVDIVRAPSSVSIGEPAYITVALSRPARVATATDSPSGYDDPGSQIKGAGRRRIPWLAPLEPGTYRVEVQATTGGASSKSESVEIRVEAPPPAQPQETGAASDTPEGPATRLVALALALLAAAVLATVASTIRR